DTDYTPNDPYFVDADPVAGVTQPQQWTSFDVQLPEAWDVTQGSEEVIIAIIDSGVDTDHPDLRDNIAMWPAGGVRGWDFVGGKDGEILEMFLPVQQDPNPDIHHNDGVDDGWGLPDPSAGDGQDVLGLGSSQCDLGVFHGTHCASCASGVADNATGVAGAGFTVKIMPVRCISPEGGLPESIWSSTSLLTMGVNWAVDNGADIISMSLGLPENLSPAGFYDAILYAYNSGVAIFAASGNNGSWEYNVPARWPEVFAVGSFSQAHTRAEFSSFGDYLDCLAGGGHYDGVSINTAEWIWGCYVSSVCDFNNGGLPPGEHGYCGAMGTSMACPQAAGIAGLLLSANPSLAPETLYNVIRSTCLDIGAPGWDAETGYGIIQARAALDALSGTTDLTVTLTPLGSTILPPTGGTLSYSASIRNDGAAPAFVDFWEDLTLPSGSTYGPVLQRNGLVLQPGAMLSRNLAQQIPGAAPAGNYNFNAYAGTYPNVVDAEDHFAFSKSGVEDSGFSGWISTGWEEMLTADPANIPDQVVLHQNYPNPFNPTTEFSYELRVASSVSLTVYDIQGREVVSLVDGYRNAGLHEVTFDASQLASGVYIYSLMTDVASLTGKMVLLK
ncbi:S8 family peptidase, partial [bacterium]|nr:S8 family peptidase [bacterium]